VNVFDITRYREENENDRKVCVVLDPTGTFAFRWPLKRCHAASSAMAVHKSS
jgi:hypothetical protein